MKLTSKFPFEKVAFDQETTTHLLITAEAPKIVLKEQRKPLNLVVALDKSSSMAGKPVEYVKKSALKLVDHLSSEDRLGIISFDHNVTADFEPMLMTPDNKEKAKKLINGIYSSGSTNFSGALLESLKWCKALDSQVRFIILTDGQPSAGECNLERILDLAKGNRTENTSITAFGYGEHHDEIFLRSLAEQGKGNYAYIQNPDDALKAFARELGGLMSCYAQNVKFKITPKDGVEIVRVISDVDVKELDNGAVEIPVTDLYSEEVRNIVLSVKLPKQDKASVREHSLFDVSLEYTDMDSGETKNLSSKAKISFVKKDDADKDPVKSVMEQVAIAEVADGQKQAQARADRGDYVGAKSALRMSTSNRAFAPGAYSAHLDSLERNLDNEVAYKSSAKSRGASGQSMRSNKFSGGAAGIGMSNSTQDAFVASFVDPGTPPASVAVGVSVQVGQQAPAPVAEEKDKKKRLDKTRTNSNW